MRRYGMKRRAWIAAIAALTAAASARADGGWRQYADPAAAGWSPEGLERAKTVAGEVGSDAVMVVDDGVVVAAWGAVDRPLPVYSMRKGLYNALAGMLVAEDRLEIGASLADLGIEEIEPLTPTERSATVEDLLTSRSGVYRLSAYEPASMKRGRPARGAHPPGEHWFYNNWDFNLVAHLIERASGKALADLFAERVAAPLGMEDFDRGDVFSFLEPSRSRFPAIVFSLSARDLARFGRLYEQNGEWEGRRLLDPRWIAASWTRHATFPEGSPFGAGNAFGYLWWVYPARPDGEGGFARRDVYLTRGSGGQVLAVLPSLGLVVVHLTAAEDSGFEEAVRVIDAILAARREPVAGADPRTTALAPGPLGDGVPAHERRTAVAWSPETRADLVGEYTFGPRISFTVHELRGRLFALPHGAPLAEVELFVDAGGTIFSPAVDVTLTAVRGEGNEVVALEGRIEGRPARLDKRVPAAADGDGD
jgi:CubicO group peptidase (beta-lactamase class C family)